MQLNNRQTIYKDILPKMYSGQKALGEMLHIITTRKTGITARERHYHHDGAGKPMCLCTSVRSDSHAISSCHLPRFLKYVCVFALMYVCSRFMQCPWKSEEGVGCPGPGVNRELSAVVLGIEPWVLWESGQCSTLLSHLSRPVFGFVFRLGLVGSQGHSE